MTSRERQQAVLELLSSLQGLEPLKELFWSELNYERVNQPLSTRSWSATAAKALVDAPVLFATGGQDNEFHVIYAHLQSDRLLLGHERSAVSRLLNDHPYALFIFSNATQDRWHFVNIKYDEETSKRRQFRRITIGPEERLRTASERVTMLDISELSGLSPLVIQERHDKAFDVEEVTRQFFDEYQTIFTVLEKDLAKQTNDSLWAHDYALQFLNRCMFLYFIQRKGWLGNDRYFLSTFWDAYRHSARTNDSFVDKWLKVLFFEAFNNRFHGGHPHFPEEVKDALSLAPFLNGGLFTQNALDTGYSTKISDRRFEQVYKFLERYNFTIAEDSPLDKEVAVDPEMIGKVYETLVNVSEGVDERGEAGIFYTPRTEIDLMCRLSLVGHLTNHFGDEKKSLLYQLVFALEPEEKVDADNAVAGVSLWPDINKRLREITVLDPACGSGSFLVGMLNILDDLQARASQQLGLPENPYDRKKRIIAQSLYGVDVMDWACHVAELRLWLALIIDADFTREELHVRREPLLPHFSFKIRCGDSLVQEVGGIDLGHIRESHDIPPSLKGRITKLKNDKQKFYDNDPSCQFRSVDGLKREEKKLFQDILDARHHEVQEAIKTLRRKIEGPQERQIRLDGTMKPHSHQMDLQATQYQQRIEDLNLELEQIDKSREALRIATQVPFVWDIAFVEIFEGDEGGFDIVIGNPPYVRQESISAPGLSRDMVTAESKRAYKDKLARSVYRAFPRFFGYNSAKGTVAQKIDAKSDLYIYCYLHGLSLLNTRGSFCFITSNSWLDVGYGADLQEFLLKHCHIKMILDNQAKRSFSNADVNTIIALFSSPDDRSPWALDRIARFVMFKVPFEHIVSPVIFDEIEETSERKATPEYRTFPIQQSLLLKDGCELKEDDEDQQTGTDFGPLIKFERYIGNKWGGKYLRAPDIYWRILEKGKGKLVRLGDVAEVRFGIKTGANEFFYLNEAKIREWGIEEEFLKPVIKSPRECKRILIDPNNLKYKLFMCHKDKKELRGTAALEYIQWGEESKKDRDGNELRRFNFRPSCRGRQRWWDLGERRLPPIISPSSVSEIPRTFKNEGVFADKRLYEIYPHINQDPILLATNAITCSLFLELGSRTGLGEGLLDLTVYELADCFIYVPEESATLARILKSFSQKDILPLRDEIQNSDRITLDSVVFNALGLTQGERDAVYEAVIQLVEARLKKAGSV